MSETAIEQTTTKPNQGFELATRSATRGEVPMKRFRRAQDDGVPLLNLAQTVPREGPVRSL